MTRVSLETRKRIWRWGVGFCLVTMGCVLVLLGVALTLAWTPMGTTSTGERLARIEKSPQYRDGVFHDTLPRVEPNILKILPKWFEKPLASRRPETPVAHENVSRQRFATPPASGTRITWLGHSTLIVEIAGKTLLIDPVFSDYVAPLELENAKRFIPPPLPFEQLPKIDAVLISHDHYDHLDYPTVLKLIERDVPFYVPLGIGAHLEYWGMRSERIFEHEWWQESQLGEVKLVCTPARHFSGRSLVDKDKTLWAGWVMLGEPKSGPSARLFYSGDTALHPEFEEIGKRYGPFDATMIENGAYNSMWADVHLGPEQAVQAHKMVKGGLLIPVHWGMFDLGLHGWTEPMERILVAAEKAGVPVATLKPGQSVEPASPPLVSRWWPNLAWQTVDEAPAFSSGMPRN